MNEILIYEPISLQTTFFLHWSQLVFIFFFFFISFNVKKQIRNLFLFYFLLFSAVFLIVFFLFVCKPIKKYLKSDDVTFFLSFAFCLSTLSFLSINFLNKKIFFPLPQTKKLKKIPKTKLKMMMKKKALKELEIDLRSNGWHCESIAVVDRIITTHHTVIMVVRIVQRRALAVPHPNAFHALAHENMKKSKFPFHIHHQRTFRVRRITKRLINCTRYIIALMARRALQRDSIVATQLQVAEEVSQATIIIRCIKTFWASHKTRWCHREPAKRWARETLRHKWKGFGWKQKVSFFTS